MSSRLPSLAIDKLSLMACAIGGVLFCAVHLSNGWLFQWCELSDHISLVYLPSFLRLANVLILGLAWGTVATAFGGALLLFWSHDNGLMGILNIGVSASAAALAVICLQSLVGRRLSPTRLMDLFLLALLCAVISASVHHLMWSTWDPAQLINPMQVPYMMVGDINGALIGALVLRWISRRSQMASLLRRQIQERA
jgi:hypothetical protein